jgi:NAD(P)-dependent dehydrogenase (short-subunit alcohol dehydrogenase family)
MLPQVVLNPMKLPTSRVVASRAGASWLSPIALIRATYAYHDRKSWMLLSPSVLSVLEAGRRPMERWKVERTTPSEAATPLTLGSGSTRTRRAVFAPPRLLLVSGRLNWSCNNVPTVRAPCGCLAKRGTRGEPRAAGPEPHLAVFVLGEQGPNLVSGHPRWSHPMSFATYPSLKSAVVFITGGASGIGEEIVKAFAAQGSRTGFVDLDAERGRALADELSRQGAEVRFEACDLRHIDQLKHAFAALEAVLGPATVLVNNAARDDRHGWEEVTPDYYDERIAANLRHMFFAIQAVAPGMIAAGKGSIINFGSNSWWQATGGMPVYTTAKAAVHGMTRSFARDLGRHRIRVNTVVPGWVMTERQKTLWATPEALERHRARQCLPDLIEPVYLARMVLFLASDDTAMCTANNYMVEAGSI